MTDFLSSGIRTALTPLDFVALTLKNGTVLAAELLCCRLATVQSGRLPAMPLVSTKHDVSDDDRCVLLSSIRQLVPDHTARFRAVQVRTGFLVCVYPTEIY